MSYRLTYRYLLYPLLVLAFKVLSFFNPKVKRALELRSQKNSQWPWLLSAPHQRPIWFHCASGEFEYAKPVIQALKKQQPDIKIHVTYFSPSIVEAVQNFKLVDFSSSLPWDEPQILKEFLNFHQPKALLIARTDAWPEMLYQTRAFKIPTLMFAATLAEKSSRMGFFSRSFSSWTLSMLTQIHCVSQADFENFKALELEKSTQIAGDTRFDQVIERLKNPKPLRSQLLQSQQKILVAGSTWPEDEKVLFDVMAAKPLFRMLLVPHEPTPAHLEELRVRAEASGLQTQLYSKSEVWSKDHILIVDQIGILAELYAFADLAFVGGSFRKTVHSVMEPLAAGCLCFVGPKHHNNREALEMKSLRLTSAKNLSPVIEVENAQMMIEKIDLTSDLDFTSVKTEIKSFIHQRTGFATQKALQWIKDNAL